MEQMLNFIFDNLIYTKIHDFLFDIKATTIIIFSLKISKFLAISFLIFILLRLYYYYIDTLILISMYEYKILQ